MLSYKIPVILIVDDNDKNLQFLGNLLEEHNYELYFAKDGKQALAFVQKHKPDLILLDVMMPNIDGFEVCSILKKNMETRHIPVIFLTAKVQMEDILRGFEVGGSDYVTKPFNSQELLARINAHIQLKFAREEISLLRKMVKICSNCKSIKNEKGKWVSIESYVSRETDFDFSHGLCPSCLKQLYPDMAEEIFKLDKAETNTKDN